MTLLTSITVGRAFAKFVGVPPAPAGQIEFTTPGTYTWIAPNVTNVSAVCIGAGAGGSNSPSNGGGGGLAAQFS